VITVRVGGKLFDMTRGQYVMTERKNANQIFNEVKRCRQDLIRAHSVTDEELMLMIKRVMSGTRNLSYMVTPAKNFPRLKDLAAYIVREYSYEQA
jgi:hypothetical protein